jgi:hypothetical protein
MYKRVETQVLSPCMQYGYHARFGLQLCVGELRYRFPCAGKQKVVKNYRVLKKQAIQFIRNHENHMEVRYRQQILLAAFHPCFPLRVLALWTMTITAGVVTDADMPALITFVDMSAQ